jgi:hypothetical protein
MIWGASDAKVGSHKNRSVPINALQMSTPHIINHLLSLDSTHTMDLGDSLQAADVIIGALSLIVTLLGAYLTWYAARGMPPIALLGCDSLTIVR